MSSRFPLLRLFLCALRRKCAALPRGCAAGAPVAVALGLLLVGSIAQAAPQPSAQHAVRLDPVGATLAPNTVPPGWRYFSFNPFSGMDDGSSYQFVGAGTPGGPYIRLTSQGDTGYGVGAEHTVRLDQQPVLSWQWRVTRLPKGGDARVKARDDQAGSVCVAVNPGIIFPDAVLCYLWENRGPRGTTGTGFNRDSHKWMILRAADEDTVGQWYTERRDLDADFRQLFGRLPGGPVAITLTIDTNDTDSSAEAFYRDIVVETAAVPR